jgi:hypothetical protein
MRDEERLQPHVLVTKTLGPIAFLEQHEAEVWMGVCRLGLCRTVQRKKVCHLL